MQVQVVSLNNWESNPQGLRPFPQPNPLQTPAAPSCGWVVDPCPCLTRSPTGCPGNPLASLLLEIFSTALYLTLHLTPLCHGRPNQGQVATYKTAPRIARVLKPRHHDEVLAGGVGKKFLPQVSRALVHKWKKNGAGDWDRSQFVVVKSEISHKAKLLVYWSVCIPTLTYGYD